MEVNQIRFTFSELEIQITNSIYFAILNKTREKDLMTGTIKGKVAVTLFYFVFLNLEFSTIVCKYFRIPNVGNNHCR